MSLSYASYTELFDEDNWRGSVRVQTSRCWYKVLIEDEEVRILGPGVDEVVAFTYLPQGLSFEGQALVAVLLFEEKDR